MTREYTIGTPTDNFSGFRVSSKYWHLLKVTSEPGIHNNNTRREEVRMRMPVCQCEQEKKCTSSVTIESWNHPHGYYHLVPSRTHTRVRTNGYANGWIHKNCSSNVVVTGRMQGY
eukprot:scaffold3763_cov165-Amphora_coffeaeformis.AAC.26